MQISSTDTANKIYEHLRKIGCSNTQISIVMKCINGREQDFDWLTGAYYSEVCNLYGCEAYHGKR